MDVFIFGQTGASKSTAARKIVNDYIADNNAPKNCTLLVSPEVLTYTHLATYMQKTEARVVIFDGVIMLPIDLNTALNAVTVYRSRVTYPVMALFCINGETKNFITYASDKKP